MIVAYSQPLFLVGQIQILHLPQTPKCGKMVAESTGNKRDSSLILCRELKCYCPHTETQTRLCFFGARSCLLLPCWGRSTNTQWGSPWNPMVVYFLHIDCEVLPQYTGVSLVQSAGTVQRTVEDFKR